jgi:hypothetical protein
LELIISDASSSDGTFPRVAVLAAGYHGPHRVVRNSVIDGGTWLYGCTHAWHRVAFDRFGALSATVSGTATGLPDGSALGCEPEVKAKWLFRAVFAACYMRYAFRSYQHALLRSRADGAPHVR